MRRRTGLGRTLPLVFGLVLCTGLAACRPEGDPAPVPGAVTASASPTVPDIPTKDPLAEFSATSLLRTAAVNVDQADTGRVSGSVWDRGLYWYEMAFDSTGYASGHVSNEVTRLELRRVGRAQYVRANEFYWRTKGKPVSLTGRWLEATPRPGPEVPSDWFYTWRNGIHFFTDEKGSSRLLSPVPVNGVLAARVATGPKSARRIVHLTRVPEAENLVLPVLVTWPEHPGVRFTLDWGPVPAITAPAKAKKVDLRSINL